MSDAIWADQWRSAAATLRAHADKFDNLAANAPNRPTDNQDLVRLLHEVDGQLGLAVYRGEGTTQRWMKEAHALIARVRAAAKALER